MKDKNGQSLVEGDLILFDYSSGTTCIAKINKISSRGDGCLATYRGSNAYFYSNEIEKISIADAVFYILKNN